MYPQRSSHLHTPFRMNSSPPEREATQTQLRALARVRDQAHADLMLLKRNNGGRVPPGGATEALGQACLACDRAGMHAVQSGLLTPAEVKECLGE